MDINNNKSDIKLPEYTGNNTFYAASTSLRITSIVFMIFYNLPFIVIAFFLLKYNKLSEFIPISIFGVLGIYSFGNLAAINYRKITIDKNGVTLINFTGKIIKHFDWDNVENIFVMSYLGAVSKSQTKFYISTDPHKIMGLNHNTPTSPEYIVLHYKPEIIHCIVKYWNKTIDNYNKPKNWQKYVNMLSNS